MSHVDSYGALVGDLPDSWVASLLEIGCNVNEPDLSDEYILTIACQHLQLRSVALALSSGANPNCHNSEGNTPLLCTIDVSPHNLPAATEIVQALLTAGADIEARGYMDKTPFLKACSRGCLEILKLLVSHGCDIHARASDVGNPTGLDFANIFDTSSEFKAYLRGLYDA